MSKKLVVIMLVILLIVPASVFAVDMIGLRVGPIAMLNAELDLDSEADNFGIDYENLTAEDFTFGADVRMNFSVVEVNALALITPTSDDYSTGNIDVYANAGLSLSLFQIVRLGASAGPMFTVAYGEEDPENDPLDGIMETNLNLRLTADVMLGDFSVGVTGIMETGNSLNSLIEGTSDFSEMFDEPHVKAGVSAMFAIF